MNLTTQAAQVACFRNVAAHLEPGGCFVIEVEVPGLQRLPAGETFRVFDVSETHWGIDEFDVANQGLSRTTSSSSTGARAVSMPFRYVWPAELDLMAELAGMRLRERWSGWQREPFTSESRKHVSVWEKGGGGRMKRTGSAPAHSIDPGRTKRPKGRFVRGGWGGGSP